MCPVVLAGVGDPSISNVPLEGVGEEERRPLDKVCIMPLPAYSPRPQGVIGDIDMVETIATPEEVVENFFSLESTCIL